MGFLHRDTRLSELAKLDKPCVTVGCKLVIIKYLVSYIHIAITFVMQTYNYCTIFPYIMYEIFQFCMNYFTFKKFTKYYPYLLMVCAVIELESLETPQ